MSFRPLELIDRKVIEGALKLNPLSLSDYSFTNLWMWNPFRSYQILQLDGFICLKFQQEGEVIYLYPIGKGSRNEVLSKLIALQSNKFTMRAIPENASLDYPLVEEPDRADYIYLYEDLLELHGNRFQAKRNLIHQLEDEYDFEYQKITPELIPKIKKMEQKWFLEHSEAEKEHQAVMHVLDDYFDLNAIGGALIVDEEVIAYSFAEYLTNEMLLVHVEKALTEFKGSYQMMNQQLLAHLNPVRYVNREEDLGLSNLRKIKNSYHPTRLEKKYRFTVS
jgi:hypothetical protein